MGPSASGIVGGSLFVFYPLADNLYLRPSIAAGETPAASARATWAAGETPAASARATWAAGRLDACTRVPGNYGSYSGLQLDLCGGTDVGATYFVSGTRSGEPPEGRTSPRCRR
jgi:hypothetical protein